MALEFAHGAIQALAANAVGVTYTVSGLSFQPKAIRFYWQGLGSAVDAASQSTHLRRGVGFCGSTVGNRACVAVQSQDAAASMTCTHIFSGSSVVSTITSTPAEDGALDMDAITSDGFRLITDDQLPVDITVFWEAWGGSDIASVFVGSIPERNGAGTSLILHGVGGTPSVVMFAGTNNNGIGIARGDSGLAVGFATGSTDAENVVVGGNNDDGSASADSDGYGRAGDCIVHFTTAGGNPSARAKITNMAASATEFELTWASGTADARRTMFMAIRGGNWKAGSLTINGNTGSATTTVSGLAFQPNGLSLIGRMTTQSAAGTSTAEDRMSLGSGSSTTSRRAMGAWDENGTATTEIDHVIEYDQVLAYPSAAGALAAALDINAMNSDGFQLIVDTAGGVASEWVGYLTFGNAGTQFTQSVAGTLTTAGALLKQARKGVSGTVTTAGAMVKQTARSLSATVTSAGAMLKQAGKTLAATLTSSGALNASLTFGVTLTATLTTAGTVARETRKVLVGVVSSSGAIVRETARAGLAGTLTTIGTLTRQTSRVFDGTLTTAGTLTRQAQKTLAGVMSSSGAIVKQTARAGLAGTVTPIGSLSRQTSKALAGTLTTAGTLTRQAQKVLAGVISASGAIVKQTARALAAAVTSAGNLATQFISGANTFFQSVSATLTPAGALSRRTDKSTSGTVTTVGTLTRQARKLLAGALTSAGALVGELVAAGQTFLQSVTATLTTAGALTRETRKDTSGTVSSVGGVSMMTARGLASTLAPAGALLKQTTRAVSSVLSFVATLLERLFGPPPPATPHVRVIVRPDVSRVIVAGEPGRVMVAADVSRVMVERDVQRIIARPDADEVL